VDVCSLGGIRIEPYQKFRLLLDERRKLIANLLTRHHGLADYFVGEFAQIHAFAFGDRGLFFDG